jgi:anti-sigma factor RsiW
MTARDHTSYREEIGAYVLGALTALERQAFEQHLESCAECRAEIEGLRPAADVLPRSVEQVEPPPSLKASLMDVVEGEARERSGVPPKRSLWARLVRAAGSSDRRSRRAPPWRSAS